ncbi:hypothetical protein E2320_008358, partial [Naja naja]
AINKFVSGSNPTAKFSQKFHYLMLVPNP